MTTQDLPASVRFCVIGAGVHGLSTAWHLAQELAARGLGSGSDVVVLDKSGVAAGASGIACGVVRNFYVQPAMGRLMAHSVAIWEAHADAFHYRPVGYVAAGCEAQAQDFESIAERHEGMGYRARLIRGEGRVRDHLRGLFPDWKARGLAVCLHEYQGGFALNRESMQGLAHEAARAGVRILPGVEVLGFRLRGDDSVAAVQTDRGEVAVDQVVVAAGPWIKRLWSQLGLPQEIDVLTPGAAPARKPMWTYWQLQEGEIRVDPSSYATRDGGVPPVVHVDSAEPLVSTATGKPLNDGMWGVYFKRDRAGVQGGAVPVRLGPEARVDPYGPESPHYTAGEAFAEYWTAGLAHCLGRFADAHRLYHRAPSGGVGCFSADNFPVFDLMRPNAYVIADSNHGYKMIGVGQQVARVLLGEASPMLRPFRFGRFAEGDLHPRSQGPFPWT